MTYHITSPEVHIRGALRVHTQAQHERLHRHSSFAALFDQTLPIGDYRQLMKRLYGFYVPLDEAITGLMRETAANEAAYSYACRSDHLVQDLRDLGYADAEIADAPRCARAASLVSARTLGGVLYVIEGATLGGTGIDRAVQKMLDHDRTEGRRFWSWCRAQNKYRWPMTTRYLDHLVAQGAEMDDLMRGARDTFRELADWLSPLDQAQVDTETRQAWQ